MAEDYLNNYVTNGQPKPFKCSICQKFDIVDGYGNNAQPVNNGRCCNDCNRTVVIPARLDIMLNNEKNTNE